MLPRVQSGVPVAVGNNLMLLRLSVDRADHLPLLGLVRPSTWRVVSVRSEMLDLPLTNWYRLKDVETVGEQANSGCNNNQTNDVILVKIQFIINDSYHFFFWVSHLLHCCYIQKTLLPVVSGCVSS